MAQTKVKIAVIAILSSVFLSCATSGRDDSRMEWSRTVMDGSRTGVKASNADNVEQMMGKVSGRKYFAPNGKVFRGGATAAVAGIVLGAQEKMAPTKTVIAHSARAMSKAYPESELTNWFIDALMTSCGKLSGKKIDIGVANFGGVRVDMPEGDVQKDDIMSMFPFKNNVCYVALRGREIREMLEKMARTKFQILGGVRCVARDGKLVSALIGGKPIDDEKVYGVATISFLLNGGDGLSLAKNAVELKMYDEYIIDVMLPYVEQIEAEGRLIEYHKDGRVQILN